MSERTDHAVGRLAELACLLEVAAPKAGNVHPAAPFEDSTWLDFVKSAHAIRPVMAGASDQSLGRTVLQAVRATREAVDMNTNLGIILLLAPLCATAGEKNLRTGVRRLLRSLGEDDATSVYQAIRLANPSGLGEVRQSDVRGDAPDDLIAAMRQAAMRDAVARQYVNDFADVFERLVPVLQRWINKTRGMDDAIVRLHLEQMAFEPDSLIARKCGIETASTSQRMAKEVLRMGWPNTAESRTRFEKLDAWLRADGARRNPGTSADLVTAALFVALRTDIIRPPFDWTGSLVKWGDVSCAC